MYVYVCVCASVSESKYLISQQKEAIVVWGCE